MMQASEAGSVRPYLIRALYEWCIDNGFTPFAAVLVNERVQVPREYVKGGEIVLNLGADATNGLKIGNEFLEFKARFSGSVREIMVPVGQVIAVYARENGQGMAFPVETPAESLGSGPQPANQDDSAAGTYADWPGQACPTHQRRVRISGNTGRGPAGQSAVSAPERKAQAQADQIIRVPWQTWAQSPVK